MPDRFGAYLKYHQGRAQFCWTHLKRDLLGILEFTRITEVERFCRDALALTARLFRARRAPRHRFRGGGLDRAELILKSIPPRKRFFRLCDRLFAFLEHPGVEPTNNSAERAPRHAVIWRKSSFGNQSAKGEVATAPVGPLSRSSSGRGGRNGYLMGFLGIRFGSCVMTQRPWDQQC